VASRGQPWPAVASLHVVRPCWRQASCGCKGVVPYPSLLIWRKPRAAWWHALRMRGPCPRLAHAGPLPSASFALLRTPSPPTAIHAESNTGQIGQIGQILVRLFPRFRVPTTVQGMACRLSKAPRGWPRGWARLGKGLPTGLAWANEARHPGGQPAGLPGLQSPATLSSWPGRTLREAGRAVRVAGPCGAERKSPNNRPAPPGSCHPARTTRSVPRGAYGESRHGRGRCGMHRTSYLAVEIAYCFIPLEHRLHST
jgi:hypothetical protein